MKDLKEVVKPFYTKCLTVNEGTNTAEVMGKLLADNFQSLSSAETKGKAQLTGQVQHFWKLIPDLKWEIQEKTIFTKPGLRTKKRKINRIVSKILRKLRPINLEITLDPNNKNPQTIFPIQKTTQS